MGNEIQHVDNNLSNVTAGFSSLASFDLLKKMANLFAASSLVPKQFRGTENFGNCVIALNMAQRMNADPLMVMQNLYVVYGNPAWSSKFLISTFNMCGRYSSIHYEEIGKKGTDSWGCVAWAIEKGSNQKLIGPEVTLDIAKKEGWYSKDGSKWKTMPEQMLRYRAASWFIRTTAPELSMGLQTVDEVIDVTPISDQIEQVEKPVNEIHENANKEVLTAELPQAQPVIDIPKNVNESPKTVTEKVEIVNKTTKTATKGPDF